MDKETAERTSHVAVRNPKPGLSHVFTVESHKNKRTKIKPHLEVTCKFSSDNTCPKNDL